MPVARRGLYCENVGGEGDHDNGRDGDTIEDFLKDSSNSTS